MDEHSGHDALLGGGRRVDDEDCLERWKDEAERKTLASSLDWILSRRDSIACEISGFMDANVRERNSVPYLCLTRAGKSLCSKWSHCKTIKFSRVGVNSSSSPMASPW